jgi:hypothetical protein
LGHGLCGGLCGSGGTTSIYNKDTSQKLLSIYLLALTMIDPATCWFEIVKATNKSATSIQDLIHNTWLAPYLKPQFIVFDNRRTGEFKREFKQICDNYGIKANQTTSHNPQVNAIIERKQKVVNDWLRSFDLESVSINLDGYRLNQLLKFENSLKTFIFLTYWDSLICTHHWHGLKDNQQTNKLYLCH